MYNLVVYIFNINYILFMLLWLFRFFSLYLPQPSSPHSLAPEIPLLTFTHHTWVWDQSLPHLYPSYQSQCGFFLNSVSCRTSIQLDYWRF